MSDQDLQPIPAAEPPATPLPPEVAVPVENVPGGWGSDFPPQYPERDLEELTPQTHGTQIDAPPIPLIGAIQFGGLVSSSERYPLGVGQTVVLGEKGRPRPRTTMIGLYTTDGTFGATVQLLGDDAVDNLSGGSFLPLGAGQPGILWLTLRRAVVRNASAAAISLGVVILQYDY